MVQDAASGHECRGPFGHDYSKLADRVRSLKGRIVYIPNVGNAGDCIITTGTFAFFRRIGLKPEIGYWRGTYPDAHLIYAGGGNLIPLYHHSRTFIERHIDICRSFTLLPHSVRGHEDLLARLDGRFAFFAREADAFDHLRHHAPATRVELSHDMAFANDFEDWDPLFREVEAFRFALPLSVDWRQQAHSLLRWRAKVLQRTWHGSRLPSGATVLNAFRTDDEKAKGASLPADNVDLSKHFAFTRDPSPFMALRIAKAFVDVIGRFDVVRTDRLHVALTAAMLGKSVEMEDNNYGKLRSVFDRSMEGIFPTARFTTASRGDLDCAGRRRVDGRDRFA